MKLELAWWPLALVGWSLKSSPLLIRATRMKRAARYEDETHQAPDFRSTLMVEDDNKRQRSTPPPLRAGPLALDPLTGTLVPRQLPPDFSSLPGVRRLILPPQPVQLQVGPATVHTTLDAVLAAVDKKVVFIFFSDQPVSAEIFSLPIVVEFGIGVGTDHLPSGLPASLADPQGTLAKECHVWGLPGATAVLVEDGEIKSTMLLLRPLTEIRDNFALWM